jgi:hypothetical protein
VRQLDDLLLGGDAGRGDRHRCAAYPQRPIGETTCGRQRRGRILDVAVGISSMVTVYRVGDSGAQSVWGDQIARLKKANGG